MYALAEFDVFPFLVRRVVLDLCVPLSSIGRLASATSHDLWVALSSLAQCNAAWYGTMVGVLSIARDGWVASTWIRP